jgi:hypothetical protein
MNKSVGYQCVVGTEIKTSSKHIERNHDDLIYLSDERVQRRDLTSMIMKFWVLYKADNFIIAGVSHRCFRSTIELHLFILIGKAS